MLVNGTTLRGAETLKRSLIDTPSPTTISTRQVLNNQQQWVLNRC